MEKREVVIVGGARTAIGSFLGGLKSFPAPRLGAVAIQEALLRARVAPAEVSEVLMGCVLTAGVGHLARVIERLLDARNDLAADGAVRIGAVHQVEIVGREDRKSVV